MADKLEQRPVVGNLTVPYMVDATQNPIDFKIVDAAHVKRCATGNRCGVCGGKIRRGPVAFIGPDDGRTCFADPWMHPECGGLSMSQCPFLSGKSDWRLDKDNPLLKTYAHNMKLFVAPGGTAHRDGNGAWHFKAVGKITKV